MQGIGQNQNPIPPQVQYNGSYNCGNCVPLSSPAPQAQQPCSAQTNPGQIYQVPSSASGVNIQIFNPSVGTPGSSGPTYNVNQPCYPANYYTGQFGPQSAGSCNCQNGVNQNNNPYLPGGLLDPSNPNNPYGADPNNPNNPYRPGGAFDPTNPNNPYKVNTEQNQQNPYDPGGILDPNDPNNPYGADPNNPNNPYRPGGPFDPTNPSSPYKAGANTSTQTNTTNPYSQGGLLDPNNPNNPYGANPNDPNNPYRPGGPFDPTNSDNPYKAGANTADPNDPGNPYRPGGPLDPSNPNNPYGANPNDPNNPYRPGGIYDPTNPNSPYAVNNANNPNNNPANPYRPGGPLDPNNPNNPYGANPNDPNNPYRPGGPYDPTNPNSPYAKKDITSDPTNPANPYRPGGPLDPNDRNNPYGANPNDPNNPYRPGGPFDPTNPNNVYGAGGLLNPNSPLSPYYNASSQNITNSGDSSKTEKKRIIELTDNYIMSLENLLNSQDKKIRLNAAKEVFDRLDEDPSRKDDKALTALINKMLQDPCSEVRVIALSALEGRICNGDDLTIQLLQKMQQSPEGYGYDASDASRILLQMAGKDVEKEVPVDPMKKTIIKKDEKEEKTKKKE